LPQHAAKTGAPGRAAKDKAAFEAEEKLCAATYPGCGCPTGPTRTEDGSFATIMVGAIAVDCVAGTCTTYVTACGKPCTGGLTCRSCGPTVGAYAVCSKDCLGDSDCGSALPSCLQDSMGGKFCAGGPGSCPP